jgi:Tol biopolymer transport system component
MRVRDRAPSLSLQRVTSTTGLTLMPVLSPDGRMVAYASDGGQDGTSLQIWVQHIGSQSAVKLTQGPGVHSGPSFSADGTRILFTRSDGARSDLYEIPARGGKPRLLVPDGGIGAFSPDGRWLVYSGAGPQSGVHLATSTGEPVRDLSAGLIRGRTAVWSPDSQRLLVFARAGSHAEGEAWVLPIDGSPPIETGLLRFLREKEFNTSWTPMPAWVAENELVFSGRNRDGWSLWRERLTDGFRPAGEPERLTTGTALDWWPSFAAGRLVYVSSHPDSNLWSIPADTTNGKIAGPLRRLTRGSGITAYPSLSTDARVMAFASDRDGNWDIYLKDVASGKERVLASGGERQMYSVITPDGSRVAFGVVASAMTSVSERR